MRIRTYDIKIVDSLFNPNESNSSNKLNASFKKYPKKSNPNYYKVYIYLEGKDIPFVKKIKYKLHSTFRNRIKSIERNPNNPNCMLTIWTWGIFNIKAEIEDINGEIFQLEHYLTYGDQINTEEITWKKMN